MSNPPFQSIFQFQIQNETKLLQTFEKIGGGLDSLLDDLNAFEKIGTLPDLIMGPSQEQQKLKNALTPLEERLQATYKLLKRQRDEYIELQKTIASSTGDPIAIMELVSELDKAELKLISTKDHLEQLVSMSRRQGGSGGMGFGASPTVPLQSIAMPLQQIGGYGSPTGQFAESISIIGDLGDSAQMLGRDLEDSIDSLRGFVDNIKMIRQQGGGLTQTLSGVVSGIGAFNIIGGLAIANVAAWSMVFQKLGDQAQDARNAVQAYLDAGERQRDLQHQINDAIETGDVEGANRAFEQAWQDYEDVLAREADIKAEQARVDERYAALGSQAAASYRNYLGAKGLELEQELKNLYAPGGPYELAIESITKWTPAMEKVEEQARNLRVFEATERLNDGLTEMGRVLDGTGDQIQEFVEESLFQRGRELAERRRMDERAEDEHQDQLDEIADEGKERRVEIEKQRLKDIDEAWDTFEENRLSALASLNKSLADVTIDEQESVENINSRYMDDRLKSLKDHIKQMAKAETEYEKNRKRRLKDLQSELLDAEFANDVARFIQSENQAKTDLKRMREDNQERISEDEAAFEEQQAERRVQRAQEIEDIRDSAEERRGELRDQYTDEKALLEKQRDERLGEIEAAAIEQTQLQRTQEKERRDDLIAEHKKRRDLELEDRKIRDQLWEEDQQRQIEKMRDGAEERLGQIEDEQEDWQRVLDTKGEERVDTIREYEDKMRAEQIGSYENALNQLRSISASYGYTSAFSADMRAAGYGTSANDMGFKNRLFGAKGAFIDEPTLMVVGEGQRPELVLPFDESKGIPPEILNRLGSSRTPPTLHFHGDVNLGEITRAEFQAEMGALVQAFFKALEDSA